MVAQNEITKPHAIIKKVKIMVCAPIFLFYLFGPHTVFGKIEFSCQNPLFNAGSKPNQEDIRKIKNRDVSIIHRLCGSDFSGMELLRLDFSNLVLTGTNFKHAKLNNSDFYLAYLLNTDFEKANLNAASLKQSILHHANLKDAELNHANLSKADLTGARLAGSKMHGANLTEANLLDANLKKADLRSANLQGANFELEPGSMPDIRSIGLAKGLSTLVFKDSPHSLVELKIAFKNAGLRDQEREITYAIRKGTIEKKEFFSPDYIFNTVFFDKPCKYGMAPWRPINILLALIPIFSIFYWVCLFNRSKTSTIWIVPASDNENSYKSIPVNHLYQNRSGITIIFKQFFIAVKFSIYAAFYIGWEDINISAWLYRIQYKDYSFKGTGLVRVMSGIQSLISVYLFALWIFVYFGRPFG
ncbi:pentapeptide repeat-containing protein [bacterium]|nr:pentapeptide repeat-containing protein [bacterium]